MPDPQAPPRAFAQSGGGARHHPAAPPHLAAGPAHGVLETSLSRGVRDLTVGRRENVLVIPQWLGTWVHRPLHMGLQNLFLQSIQNLPLEATCCLLPVQRTS